MKHPQQGCPIAEGWNFIDPINHPAFPAQAERSRQVNQWIAELDRRNSLRPDNAKPARKDLTPRQIEWCRANIPAFMPRVINAPR